ncbi:hypothetical protein GCM10009555_054160 [Acrocarpospora macrocephala]|uniref:Uncharacterized protein n=1 Tax=Acrocarpospora macrocephala TaxID=150177 RepID=A0A5M3X897_9ACTN|nr:hypothetical protein [Acrocarpospora macrocephala]GES14408.1 hypothetical protein Amac_080050 [Acrocarpospora macrocephala]
MPLQESSEDSVGLDYGQFFIHDVGTEFDITEFAGDAWFQTMDNCALILGMTSGMYASVKLELWSEPPDPVDPDDWSDDPISSQLFSEFGEICVSDVFLNTQTAYLLLGEEDTVWNVLAHRRPTSDSNYPEDYLFQFWKNS